MTKTKTKNSPAKAGRVIMGGSLGNVWLALILLRETEGPMAKKSGRTKSRHELLGDKVKALLERANQEKEKGNITKAQELVESTKPLLKQMEENVERQKAKMNAVAAKQNAAVAKAEAELRQAEVVVEATDKGIVEPQAIIDYAKNEHGIELTIDQVQEVLDAEE